MRKVSFIKFGNAITVNGSNIMSAAQDKFEIYNEGQIFSVVSKRNPGKPRWTCVTNVSEWEFADDEVKTVAAKKTKTTNAE